MKNNTGSALLTTLIICLILSSVGLSLITLSKQGIFSASLTKHSTELTKNEETELTKIIQKFKESLLADQDLIDSFTEKLYTTYNAKLKEHINNYKQTYTSTTDPKNSSVLEISDITSTTVTEGGFSSSANALSHVLQFKLTKTSTENDKSITKTLSNNLMLSPVFSAAKFSVGSENNLVLNGPVELYGDLAAQNITLSKFPSFYINKYCNPAGFPRDPVRNAMPEGQSFELEEIARKHVADNPTTATYPILYEQSYNIFPIIEGNLFIQEDVTVSGPYPHLQPDRITSVNSLPAKAYKLNANLTSDYKKLFSRSDINNYFHPKHVNATLHAEKKSLITTTYEKAFLKSLNASLNRTLPLNTDYTEEFRQYASTTRGGTTGTIGATGVNAFNTLLDSPIDVPSGGMTAEEVLENYQKSDIYIIEANTNMADLYTPDKWGSAKVILLTDFIKWPTAKAGFQAGFKNEQRAFHIDKNIDFKDKDVIVDGNLFIQTSKNSIRIKGEGNIYVNGKLKVYGDTVVRVNGLNPLPDLDLLSCSMAFYVNGFDYLNSNGGKIDLKLGNLVAEFHNLRLQNYTHNTEGNRNHELLIVWANGDLTFRRINEFANSSTNKDLLNLFCYSTGNVKMYGVSSLLRIQGGVFANKTLELNGIRLNNLNCLQLINHKSFITINNAKATGNIDRLRISSDQELYAMNIDRLPMNPELGFTIQ